MVCVGFTGFCSVPREYIYAVNLTFRSSCYKLVYSKLEIKNRRRCKGGVSVLEHVAFNFLNPQDRSILYRPGYLFSVKLDHVMKGPC